MALKIFSKKPSLDADECFKNSVNSWVGKKSTPRKYILAKPAEQKRKTTSV